VSKETIPAKTVVKCDFCGHSWDVDDKTGYIVTLCGYGGISKYTLDLCRNCRDEVSRKFKQWTEEGGVG
jgi:hypothetical protein